MSVQVASAPSRALDTRGPYKGLAPFTDTDVDALLFFGRERERDVIVANIVASRLTILYGPSGVGKSSLLHAGVVYRLRELAEVNELRRGSAEHAVCVVEGWTADPIQAVADAVVAAVPNVERTDRLPSLLDAAARAAGGHLYLVLDQFEEYLLYHGGVEGGPLGETLAELLADRRSGVNVLISLREDSLAQLDVFKRRIPNVFANSLRLDRLDRRSGHEAIVGPLDRYAALTKSDAQFAVEPELVEAVLDEVEVGKVDLGTGGSGEVPQATRPGIEAPFLQLVMDRVWVAERASDSAVLRKETLERLGGAEKIVRAHVEDALAELSSAQKAIASAVFRQLVTPSGAKIAHSSSDLANYAESTEAELAPVLARLDRDRILRAIESPGSNTRFEIFHDVLASAVLDWRARDETERQIEVERVRHRRALRLVGVVFAGLVVMTAIATYAVLQRSEARDSARAARARELVARSIANLGIDPQKSLSLATRGAELEQTPQAETTLRRALIEARLRKTMRLGSPITVAEYGPGGTLLLGTASGTVLIGAHRIHIPPPVSAASFDRSGARVVIAAGTAAHVIDARTGETRRVLRRRGRVNDVSFSRDGRSVLTASEDRSASIWNSRNGRLNRSYRLPGAAFLVGVSPSGHRIAVVAYDKAGHAMTRLFGRRGPMRLLPQIGVSDVEFSPDGRLLAVASHDGSVTFWQASNGRFVRRLADESDSLADEEFSPDGTLLATASSDGGIRVWDVKTGQRTFFFTEHAAPATHVAFDPTGTYVVSTSADRTARIWATGGIEAGRRAALLAGNSASLATAGYASDGNDVVTAGADGVARVWDARIEQQLAVAAREAGPPAHVSFIDRAFAAVVGEKAYVHRAGRAPKPLPASTIAAFSVDGAQLAYVERAGRTVRIESLRSGRTISTVRASQRVTALAFRADGRDLAAATFPRGVEVWDLERQRVVARFPTRGFVRALALSPTGDVVATGGAVATGSDGAFVRLWSTRGLVRALKGHLGAITSVRFDASGTRLVSASADSSNNAIEWSANTGERLHVLVGHFGTVTAASFSSDGRWILTAGPIAAAIWSTSSGALLFYLRGPSSLLTDAEWSASGYRVVTGERGGIVRTYSCELCRPLDGIIAVARARLAAAG